MSSASFFAHSADGVPKERWHRLADHLRHTGDRAAAFLERSGCGDYARVAGMLHDLGKYTPEFQRRLSGDPRRVDHSTAGAQLASDRYGNLVGRILAFCIAGHHAGLANGAGDGKVKPLMDRLGATVPALDSAWEEEVSLPSRIPPPPVKPRSSDTAAFVVASTRASPCDSSRLRSWRLASTWTFPSCGGRRRAWRPLCRPPGVATARDGIVAAMSGCSSPTGGVLRRRPVSSRTPPGVSFLLSRR